MTNYQTDNKETNVRPSSIPVPIGSILDSMGLNPDKIGDPAKRKKMAEAIAASFHKGDSVEQ